MREILLIVLVLVGGCSWFGDPSVAVSGTGVEFEYVVRYAGGGPESAELPLLVALHGNGDSPGNFFDTALDQLAVPARILLIKGPLPAGTGGAWPMDAAGMRQYGEALNEAIGILADRYAVSGKPAVFGFSGGAFMAYYLAAVHPERFSYIFPISGSLPAGIVNDGRSQNLPTVRVRAFHGTQDSLISPAGGRSARAILEARGIDVTLVEFKGGHHGLFTNAKAEISQVVNEALREL